MKLEHQGITGVGAVYYNLLEHSLMEVALNTGEGHLGQGGTLLVSTGKFTGRSPKDKFVVRTREVEDKIWWENNPPMDPENFDILFSDMLAHMAGGTYYVQDLYAGADAANRLDVRVVTELAWHSLFIRHLLRRPALEELDTFLPEWTIVNCPSFKADPKRHGCRTDTIIAVFFFFLFIPFFFFLALLGFFFFFFFFSFFFFFVFVSSLSLEGTAACDYGEPELRWSCCACAAVCTKIVVAAPAAIHCGVDGVVVEAAVAVAAFKLGEGQLHGMAGRADTCCCCCCSCC